MYIIHPPHVHILSGLTVLLHCITFTTYRAADLKLVCAHKPILTLTKHVCFSAALNTFCLCTDKQYLY